MITIIKDPLSDRHYSFIFQRGTGSSDHLEPSESLDDVEWEVVEPGDDALVIGSGAKAPTNDETSSTVWLAGGTNGERYLLRGTPITDHVPPQTLDPVYVRVIMTNT